MNFSLKCGSKGQFSFRRIPIFLMKSYFLFIIIGITTLHAKESYSQDKIDINVENVTYEELFTEIQQKTKFIFFYKDGVLSQTDRITVIRKEASLEEILETVFRGKNLKYKIDDRQVIILPEDSITKKKENKQTGIQDFEVSGTVVDGTGMPLPGATVMEKGTNNGVQTDFDGNYSLMVTDENATLIISFIGMVTQEIPVNGSSQIDIVLKNDQAQLEEVVVIGYGSVRKSDLTGSVSSIQAEKLNTDSQASVDQIIQGRLPGVQVTQGSAEPGGNFSLRIRGANSITAGNEPLYVIDGLPGANPGNSLNPSDIKSIEVLKDASATAIYGARGSNGVVLITTKQGRVNSALDINYNFSTSIQKAAKTLEMMNAQEYMSFYNDVYEDRGLDPLFSPEEISTIGTGTNWQDEIFRSAPIQEHRLSFSGGSEDTQYYLSLSAFDQDGIVINSGFKRLTGRVNLTHSIGDKVKIGFHINNSFEKENRVPLGLGVNMEAGVIAAALQLPPTLPVYNPDGSYSTSLQDLSNPVAQAETIDEFEKTTRLFGNGYVEYEVLSDLKAKLNVGFDQRILRRETFLDLVTQKGNLAEGQATQRLREFNSNLFEFTLDYNKEIRDKHRLNLLGGYSFQRFRNSGFSAAAQNFPTTSFGPNNLGAGDPSTYDVGSLRGENTIVSGFGRIYYAFDDRYILSGSFRADGSSRFGENNKFAYFPSGAIAWNISNESFFPEKSLITDLKLRTSYGLSGNQEIDNGRSLVLLGSGPIAVFDGEEVQSIAPTQLANPDLKWETTESLNLGIDFGILNNRISGTVEYFQSNTRDLLLFLPIPTTTGFDISLQNVGDTRNSGFEFSLTSRNFINNFKWTTDFNIATLNNEVTNLGELPRILQGDTRFIQNFTLLNVGQPINSYYGYEFAGVFQSQTEIDNSPTQPDASVGGRKFNDLNNDGVINDDDKTVLGDPFPDFTMGLNNSFGYKGLSLDVFLEGKFGFELANFTNIDSENPIDDLRNRQTYVLDRWTPENPTNDQPSFVNPSRTFDFNSRVVEDASFLRLRSARLAYTFPNLNIRFISSLMVYASGQNLITWTDYRGYNPDVNSLGDSNLRIDYSAYPLARTYTLGINLNL